MTVYLVWTHDFPDTELIAVLPTEAAAEAFIQELKSCHPRGATYNYSIDPWVVGEKRL